MHSVTLPSTRVAIVDDSPNDYGNVLAAIARPDVSMHFMLTGHDAIRFARRWHAGVWVINSNLCDMSGFELAETIRGIKPNALVFIIGDDYCMDDEMQTLTLGLAKYVCKPLEPSWILPHSEDACIPMPILHAPHTPPTLRLVAADALRDDAVAESESERAAEIFHRDDAEVILQFDPQQKRAKRRPAA